MVRLEIDPALCKGCMLCTRACPLGLLEKGDDFNDMGYYPVVMHKQNKCKGCKLCAEVCPDVAILIWK